MRCECLQRYCQPKIHGALTGGAYSGRMAKCADPFRWFDSSPEVIGLVVMVYGRYPLSLRNVGDLLFAEELEELGDRSTCHLAIRSARHMISPTRLARDGGVRSD